MTQAPCRAPHWAVNPPPCRRPSGQQSIVSLSHGAATDRADPRGQRIPGTRFCGAPNSHSCAALTNTPACQDRRHNGGDARAYSFLGRLRFVNLAHREGSPPSMDPYYFRSRGTDNSLCTLPGDSHSPAANRRVRQRSGCSQNRHDLDVEKPSKQRFNTIRSAARPVLSTDHDRGVSDQVIGIGPIPNLRSDGARE